MKIIGINDGHNASCVYMENGRIVFALQEERLSKVKNQGGMPEHVFDYLESGVGIKISEADAVVFTSHYTPISPKGRESRIRSYKRKGAAIKIKQLLKKMGAKRARATWLAKKRKKRLLMKGVNPAKIETMDHHFCHAASAYYGWGKFDEAILVLTNDGAGDGLCATVSIGRDRRLERIASVHMSHSLGELWALFTAMMGMVPLEHEYKLMGLAPYAPQMGVKRVKQVFENYFSFAKDGLTWRVKQGRPAVPLAYNYFRDKMEFMRFDWIAGGLQAFTERFLCHWVKSSIAKTGVHKVALAGGTFMNVKANQKISEIEGVEDLFIFPSCGDETLPFGAAYYVYNRDAGISNKPLGHLYLGSEYSNDEIRTAYEHYPFEQKYVIKRSANIVVDVVDLLVGGHIVAWFQGREEFGARALGARSIVADPTRGNVINEINEMIKSRDFWMPFASSILEEGVKRYLVNPKGIQSPYMVITFETTKRAAEIAAGRHPFDLSCRPQIVNKGWHPKYYGLLKAFEQKTNRLGILNTSFNLHGLPIVSSPEDAFSVLEKSGLQYLAIGDWLIKKIGCSQKGSNG